MSYSSQPTSASIIRETPPHMSRTNTPEEDDRPEYTFDYGLSELKPFDQTAIIAHEDISERSTSIQLNIPTVKTVSEYQRVPELRERRKLAIELASAYYRRNIDADIQLVFSERLAKVFAALGDILDDLLTNVRLVKSRTGELGYAPQHEAYTNVTALLYRMQQELQQYLYIAGKGVPEYPKWGKDGELNTYLPSNEYEIFATAYCTEVEHFIRKFDSVYDFVACEPRNKSLLDNSQNLISSVVGSSIRKKEEAKKKRKEKE